MPNITLSIPQELYEIMKKHKEIKWSEIARKALWDYAKKLELLDAFLSTSELTEEDVAKLSTKIKEAVLKRHLK